MQAIVVKFALSGTPITECRVRSSESRVKGTENRVQSTESRVQTHENCVKGTKTHCHGTENACAIRSVPRGPSTAPTGLLELRAAAAARIRASGTGSASALGSAPGFHSSAQHLHRDWAHPYHICTETGLTPPTSARGAGLGKR